jgi:competence protein ComEC
MRAKTVVGAIALSFSAGLLLGAFMPYLPAIVCSLLLLLALGSTWLERCGRQTVRQAVAGYGCILAGFLYWTVFAALTGNSDLLERAGSDPVTIIGTVVEPPRQGPHRVIVVLSASEVQRGTSTESAKGRLRVTWREPDLSLFQGDTVRFTARVRPPAGVRNPGGFDSGAYLRRQGIDAVASVTGSGGITKDGAASVALRWMPWRVVDDWRERIRHAAAVSLEPPAVGLYLSLVLGQSDYLDADVRDAFMATGTVHILSVSGSHLGMIAWLSFMVIREGGRRLPARWLQRLSRVTTPTRLAACATVLPVSAYAVLTGAEVATVRSLLMIVLFLLAVWLGREKQLGHALAVAAVVILLHDPRALFDISFQLSFGSVLAIVWVLEERRKRENGREDRPADLAQRAGAWAVSYCWITGGVVLATTPLVAYYFNQIPWMGLGANLLIVPLAGMLAVPLGLLSALWCLLTGDGGLPGAFLNQWVLERMVRVVESGARLPGAEWHVASPTVPALALFYGLAGVWVLATQWSKARWVALTGMVLLTIWWGWSPRSHHPDELRVTFLDVGQGDAAVLELPNGQTVLVDGGASYDTLDLGRTVVGPFLWDRGIRKLDHMIATHPQLDHIGGLSWVLTHFEVSRVWGNGMSRSEPFFERYRSAMRAQGLTESTAATGQEILTADPCRMVVLNPPPPQNALDHGGATLNNLSVVTQLECGRFSILFAADVEREALARMVAEGSVRPATVVKVPHHGAKSSVHPRWLQHVGATVAVISVGARNPYGHPAREVLDAYEQEGARVLRTDLDGSVWVTGGSGSFELETYTMREWTPRVVPWNGSLTDMMRREIRNVECFRKQWLDT